MFGEKPTTTNYNFTQTLTNGTFSIALGNCTAGTGLWYMGILPTQNTTFWKINGAKNTDTCPNSTTGQTGTTATSTTADSISTTGDTTSTTSQPANNGMLLQKLTLLPLLLLLFFSLY